MIDQFRRGGRADPTAYGGQPTPFLDRDTHTQLAPAHGRFGFALPRLPPLPSPPPRHPADRMARSRARRLLPVLTFVTLGMVIGAPPPLPAISLRLPLSPHCFLRFLFRVRESRFLETARRWFGAVRLPGWGAPVVELGAVTACRSSC
jgi:hypothetical protein